jgi:hypothetical protein
VSGDFHIRLGHHACSGVRQYQQCGCRLTRETLVLSSQVQYSSSCRSVCARLRTCCGTSAPTPAELQSTRPNGDTQTLCLHRRHKKHQRKHATQAQQ